MFDEIDEATAIFKISPSPPVTAHFVDTEGMTKLVGRREQDIVYSCRDECVPQIIFVSLILMMTVA